MVNPVMLTAGATVMVNDTVFVASLPSFAVTVTVPAAAPELIVTPVEARPLVSVVDTVLINVAEAVGVTDQLTACPLNGVPVALSTSTCKGVAIFWPGVPD